MNCLQEITDLLSQKNLSGIVFMQSAHKKEIVLFQEALYYIGFGPELQYAKFGADGKFGNSTQNALIAFARKNKKTTKGKKLTPALSVLLHKAVVCKEAYLTLAADRHNKDVEKIYAYKSTHKGKIAALQLLLAHAGYDRELEYDKYGNDGFYESCTVRAIRRFAADNHISSDRKKMTTTLCEHLLTSFSPLYVITENTSIPKKASNSDSLLVSYTNTRFTGNEIIAHTGFLKALDKINTYAEKADVLIHVTSSFRKPEDKLKGAIVKPASRSNHLVGHAIDMNVRYGKNYINWCTSKELGGQDLPEPVKKFIDFICADKSLRWGGHFKIKDPVHIDDNFNANAKAWDNLYKEIRERYA